MKTERLSKEEKKMAVSLRKAKKGKRQLWQSKDD